MFTLIKKSNNCTLSLETINLRLPCGSLLCEIILQRRISFRVLEVDQNEKPNVKLYPEPESVEKVQLPYSTDEE